VPKHRRKFLALDDPRRMDAAGTRNPTVDFRGERRSNATHTSTTYPEALLAKKATGREAQLAYQATVVMENRHGLAVGARVTEATGTAEWENAIHLVEHLPYRHAQITVGADKGFDGRVLDGLRPWARPARGPATEDGHRRSDHETFGIRGKSWTRKRIEEIFGWLKTIGLVGKRGCEERIASAGC
jgi:hypothetical protein